MSDMTMSHAHGISQTTRKEKRQITWSDRLTALFMVTGSIGVWALMGFAFVQRLP